MASNSVGDEENDNNVLSDVEGDDEGDDNNDRLLIDYKNLSKEDISLDKFREVVEQLENEKKLRLAVENSKSEIENKFVRLKAYAQDIIKKRDEFKRLREEDLKEKEEALRLNDKLSGELEEALRVKEDVLKQKDEIGRQLDEMTKAKDLIKSETEIATQMLSSGIEKISGKVSNFKNFSAGGLPKSQRYTGLPGIAYGVIKRTHEIVEEIVKQYDGATKSRNDARELMEQRNYEIAIEVSQLEATISGLREEVAKKISDIENLEKLVADKDVKFSEMDRDSLEKQNMAEREIGELREVVSEYEHKLRSLESKVDSQRPLLIDQVNYITRFHEQIHSIIKIVDAAHSDQSDLADSLFIPPQEMDVNENLQASLDLMKSTSELINIATEKLTIKMQDWTRETKGLNETVARLVKEKQHIGALLRSALPKKMTFDPQSKTSEALLAAENGLREIGIDARFSSFLGNGKGTVLHDKKSSAEAGDDEVYTLAGALENIVKACQLEILELQSSVDELRTESSLLKAHVEAQSKELSQRKHRIEELEEKERVANESVEGLMLDIAAAEEEITRWKVAAEQEAAAGRAVEQEFIAKVSYLG
ncbi:Paramyosin [Thalictrum thalictroides]|uniref:Paramyosin n=1 Tax=Thalictrum thalictroides TaxID=46969 RepID=A0A7J6VH61_THATH|nr:Paramyosin [Thalictrum thalictroides]